MKLLLPALAATTLLTASLFAQNATTTPVGVVTLEVKAKPTNSRSFNFLSLPLVRPAVFNAVVPVSGISTVEGRTVLTFPANTFNGTNFAAVSAPHYLEISTGDHAGITSQILSNSNSTVTLTDDLSGVLVAGTTPIAIRPNWTLGTAFPNGEGFQKGTNPTAADILALMDPDNGNQNLYFFSSTANEWRRGLTRSNDVIIPPDSGIWIERKSTTGGFTVKLTGEVKVNQSAIYVGGNATLRRTLAPNLYPIDSVTLAQSGLYTGNSETGVHAASNPADSDNLIVFNPVTGQQTTYFYNSSSNQWRTGLTPANDIKLPANSSVMIIRKSGRQPFVWYLPKPAMALN